MSLISSGEPPARGNSPAPAPPFKASIILAPLSSMAVANQYRNVTKKAPPTILPSVTGTRFQPNILPHEITAGSCGNKFAIVNIVIFATLCSMPVVMKANKHHHIIINLPESLVHLPTAAHIARQTSQLQKIPLKNNSHHGAFILKVAAFNMAVFHGSGANMPDKITISAKIIEPARFPIYVQSQPNIASAKVTVPLRVPLKISRL